MFTKEFVAICEAFTENRQDVLDVNVEDGKKVCKYIAEFNSYVLEFRYVKKELVFYKPSSLYCVIRLRKNSVVYYHLTDIIPFLKRKTFKSTYFWNIESPDRLKNCFDSLVATIETITSQLEPFLADDTVLLGSLFNSYKMLYSLKETALDFNKIENVNEYDQKYFLDLQNMRDGYIFSRYSGFAPYKLLLKNKVGKALEKYEKLNEKNKLLEYEKHLIKHIKSSKEPVFVAFEPSCDTSAAEKLMTPLASLLSFAVIFALASLFFCGFFAVYNLVISANALVVLCAPWYMGFLCASLCSIFGAIALMANKPIRTKGLTKKERDEFSAILASKVLKKIAVAVFALTFLVSVFFSVMMLTSNVRFYDDELSFYNKTYRYSSVDSVYYIEARHNTYGTRIERGSYVILFDDKTSLDLDGFASVKYTEKAVLPLLKDKGFDVKTVGSEKDLPWYTE